MFSIRGVIMNKKVSNVVRRLVKLANRLDAKNKFVLADQTDALIQKIIKTADEDGSYMSVQSLRSIHDHSGELLKLINGLFNIVAYEQRGGQSCVVLAKC